MFESAELKHKLSDKQYDAAVPKLRETLLDAQFDLLEKKERSLLIIVGGVEGAGKGDTINLLSSWLDPRYLDIHALSAPSDEERARPEYYRHFRRLPPKGKIGVHFGSWHSMPIVNHAFKRTSRLEMDAALVRINQMERILADEGWIILKLWFHLSKDQQEKRLKKLSKDKQQSWRVTDSDWKLLDMYDRFAKVSARALRETSTDYAPWHIIPGADPNYRHITVGQAVLAALKPEKTVTKQKKTVAVLPSRPADGVHVLNGLDLTKKLTKKRYEAQLEELQSRLSLGLRDKKFQNRSLALVFEGSDAAGKGSAIRRITPAMDVRKYHITPVASPTQEERLYPYLWRFWKHVPKAGHVAIFDRSWYGRVLVERVEGFCSEADWMRGYTEINEFEEQMHERGTEVIKFWLATSPEEQMRRFKERAATGFKRYKITEEDWRNRKKWPEYEWAVNDMVDRTSTEHAPWTLVEAEDKRYARIKVLKTIVRRLENIL
ncbi:MAG TPA: polyphosphate:AMP phosphotransferase [Pseudomonadales bacterium]|nr:polyphosphate:AMP phosphotransferase [Pseudomonadales bacterium]